MDLNDKATKLGLPKQQIEVVSMMKNRKDKKETNSNGTSTS